jgi:alpha-amylase
MRKTSLLIAFTFLIALGIPAGQARAQAGLNDDRVMLQGFYWESYRHGHPGKHGSIGSKKWYEIVKDQAGAIRDARFDLIWLPPPSFAGDYSAGYDPREYFNLSNSYGDETVHRAALVALLNAGVEPVADIVINHRNGSTGWADFKNPDWGTWAITFNDNAFTDRRSEAFGTPLYQRGAQEEKPLPYAQHGGTTYEYDSFRDLDHTSERVRRDLIRYLMQLKNFGYRGWRYDMVHGYHARWIAVYNRASQPTFSVGEYDWAMDKQPERRGWVWHSAAKAGDLATASNVFDFSTLFTLRDNKGNYRAWYGLGLGIGLVGDNSDGHAWRNRAVTFVENHDTGYRTKDDGDAEKDHEHDSFKNNWEVEQAYAQILTHPGVPTVFWKHYFDWGNDLRGKIRALINARKVAGVNAGSSIATQDNAKAKGVYAARVTGSKGELYVRIGGDDSSWQPKDSGYANYKEYAAGDGWKVWVGLPGNPPFQDAPLKGPITPVPTPIANPTTISVPDSMLN